MAEGRAQRRLAAIMAADVVGYSRLAEADEERTRSRLNSLHYEIIDPRISADGGRIVKTMGDGILVEFPSAVDAVRNALSIQSAVRRRNADVIGDDKIEIRFGINVGDIIVEGDDIHGDGVNVAARLEGLCEPGEVYVSGTVYDQADGKLEARFEDLGEQSVKNIAKQVRVYRAVDSTNQIASTELHQADKPVLSEKPTIAVLPFDNMSNDPDQEYFSDGMAEDLITDISQISGLAVTARNSSFAFKGQAMDVKEIAKQLGVKHIVEGSVRKMGDRLRVNAQLIDGTDGQHIWAARYDGEMSEIFDFQDDIREQIVSALQVSLTPTDKALTERNPTESVEAYDLFLKGRANMYRHTPEHTLEAIKHLEEAIEIDPNFAAAYSFLAWCYFYGWIFMWAGFDETLDHGHQLAEKAVTLDGASAIAFTSIAVIQTWMRRYDQAASNAEKALALAPDNTEVYATCGQLFSWHGRPEKGIELIERALRRETFTPVIWDVYAGITYYLLRRYDEALTAIDLAIQRIPNFMPTQLFLACTYAELDRLDDAQNAVEALLEIMPNYTVREVDRFLPFRSDEDRNRFLDALRKAGLPEG